MFFEKVVVLKVQYETEFFKKVVFGNNYQKVLFEKVECLANTYKSVSLSCKLSKRTRYI